MRVLLSGYYGFGNHGDEALLAGLIQGLAEHGHEAVVLSADPDATRRLHGVEAHSRTTGLVRALWGVDALVSGGGGLLQDATSARSLIYYLGVIRLARLLGKRAVVYGQSVGPLSPRGRRWLRYALQGIPIAVRDRPSQELLADLGLASTRTADAALLIGPPDRTASGGQGAHADPDRAEPVVLVPRAGFPEHTAALAEIARRLHAQGIPIETVVLHRGRDDRDAQTVQRSATGEAPVVPADFRDAFRHAAGARTVVSARLHALVFAAAAGIPHIGLVYDPKVAGFLEESGGSTFSPPFDVEALYRAVMEPPRTSEARRRQLLEKARAGMAWLDDALRSEA